MPNVVTGISATGDTQPLVSSLRSAGLPLEPLEVMTAEVSAPDALAAPRPRDEIAFGTTGTGTGVPGLTTPPRSPLLGERRSPLGHEARLVERLGALDIPDDALESYLEALEAGRSVVGYVAKPETVGAVETLFRAAGLARVRVY